MVPPIVLLFFWQRWEWEYMSGVWSVGLLLLLSGTGLRVWSQRYLKYRLREERALATGGPYATMRNPVYVGNVLILAGLCVLCELPWMIPLVCGWALLVYDCAIRFEEGRLMKHYGDAYTAYRQRTHRWWPRIPTADPSNPGTLASWLRAASVEWQCLLLPAIPLLKEYLY